MAGTQYEDEEVGRGQIIKGLICFAAGFALYPEGNDEF